MVCTVNRSASAAERASKSAASANAPSKLHTLQLFTVTAGGISRVSVFQDADVFAAFGLAKTADG